MITFFFQKSGVIQCGSREVSTAHKKIWAIFIFQKNLWKPWRKPANLPYFRLPAPIGHKFDMVSRTFLKYKNGSNFFYDLLRPFPIHTVLPHIFKKNVITLVLNSIVLFMLRSPIFWNFWPLPPPCQVVTHFTK